VAQPQKQATQLPETREAQKRAKHNYFLFFAIFIS
jgi:hypothetical protein